MRKCYRLAELAEIGRGSSPRPITDQRYFVNGDIPWIKIADATSSGKYIYETKEHVNDYGASFSRKLNTDSLIIAASGTLGFPKFLGVEGCIHDGWMYFSDIKENIVKRDFLYYYLITLNGYFNNLSYGAAIQNINTPIVKKTKVFLPPINTQNRIASILSAYDELIEKNNRKIAILQEQAQELYKEWFVRLRFPGYESVKFENGLPEGWVECRFSEKADIMSGGTPKTDEASYYSGSIPFYTPKDSVDNFFSFETLSNITEEGLAHCNSQFYPAKTVMITARGTVGNINLLAVPMAMNQSCYALKMKAVDCPYFLFFSIMQEIKKLKCIATGGVFDTIIVKTFDTIRLVMPKTNILMQFEKAISPIMEQILCIEKKNKNLICQRDLLLPRLMSGKLEV